MKSIATFIELVLAQLMGLARDVFTKELDNYRAERGLPPPSANPTFPTAEEEPVPALPAPRVALPSIPLGPPTQPPRKRGRPPKQRPVDPATSFETEIQEMQ